MRKLVYGGHFGKWPPKPSGAKSSEMALYPNIFLMMKSKFVPNTKAHNSAIFCFISAGL